MSVFYLGSGEKDRRKQRFVDKRYAENTNRREMEIKQKYHHFSKWECVKNGFYDMKPPLGKTDEECFIAYRDFLRNLGLFERYIEEVFKSWKNSCEHFLTNAAINRIAWIGQASMCAYSTIPSKYRSGYFLLSEEEKNKADSLAEKYLNIWLEDYKRNECRKDQLELVF